MSCTNLTSTEIDYLTRILKVFPNADPAAYRIYITALLSSPLLPSRLKCRGRLSVLLGKRTTFTASPLCTLHRRLYTYTVHSLFKRIALEVGRNLQSLVLNCQLLSVQQRDLVGRLREVHAMWLALKVDPDIFVAAPPDSSTWHLQYGGCEACMLARIGGNPDVLLDLRTVLLSRTRTKAPKLHRCNSEPPTLLGFVEAWLKGLAVGGKVLEENRREAQALKATRKKIWRQRAKQRHRCSGGMQPEPEPQSSCVTDVRDLPDLEIASTVAAAATTATGGGTSGSDIEMDIIEHYTTKVGTLHSSSVDVGSQTRAVNSEGSYVSRTTSISSTLPNRRAEEQAKSYQDLVGPPPLQGTSGWDLDLMVEEGESSPTQVRPWSVICIL